MNKQVIIIVAIVLLAVIIIVSIKSAQSKREKEIELAKQRTGVLGDVYGQQGDPSTGVGYLGASILGGLGGLFKKKDETAATEEAASNLESAANTSAMMIQPTETDYVNSVA